MKYRKILEVKEDSNHVFFEFLMDGAPKIIGLPKSHCHDKSIYSGTNYQCLNRVDGQIAKLMLDSLMKRAMENHPSISLCDVSATKLLNL
jgi:hypothetical protein